MRWIEELIKGIKSGKAKNGEELLEDVEKNANAPSNIEGDGLYGGKILAKEDIENWEKYLFKKFKTKLQKVEEFDDPAVLAQFDSNTNTIRYKDDVTEYIMAHESYHAEEMSKIGFDEYVKSAPLKGVLNKDFTEANWVHRYKREKYVYDRIIENAPKHNLNNQELNHAYMYLDIKCIYELEIRNIKIPK